MRTRFVGGGTPRGQPHQPGRLLVVKGGDAMLFKAWIVPLSVPSPFERCIPSFSFLGPLLNANEGSGQSFAPMGLNKRYMLCLPRSNIKASSLRYRRPFETQARNKPR